MCCIITRWVGVIGVSWPELSVRTGKSTGNRSVGDLTDKVNRQGSRKACKVFGFGCSRFDSDPIGTMIIFNTSTELIGQAYQAFPGFIYR